MDKIHAAPLMAGALCVLAIGYRFYSAFIATQVLMLNDSTLTPAHRLTDGHNFIPNKRWVLFGHHFAAISGSGPLIGPTLAAQFGFAPGLLWLLAGVVLCGAVHDFVILTASVRHNGRSIAEMARELLGPVGGFAATLVVLIIVTVSMAGLGIVVVGALAESAWGTFTVAATIPIAMFMGFYSHKLRPGAVGVATLVGVIALVAALLYGKVLQDSTTWLRFSRTELTWGLAAYGFVASVLPVWLLLLPRDYLSSYLKIGTIALLVGGVLIVNPEIKAPAISEWVHGGGPIVKGPLYPFMFVTIACGAISGFHSLIASGTTPKMLDKESDARVIGYGGMLMESLVGVTALIAASSLPVSDYLAINTDPVVTLDSSRGWAADAIDQALSDDDRKHLGLEPSTKLSTSLPRQVPLSKVLSLSARTLASAGFHVDPKAHEVAALTHDDFGRLGIEVNELPQLALSTQERIAARTGGGVSLAVGMARIFAGVPWIKHIKNIFAYWYHFAIMFEALFILTTIDAGTRVGRFLVQEVLGKLHPALGNSANPWAGVLATALMVSVWVTILLTGSVQTIWPMFGIANQLLAVVALTVGTTYLIQSQRRGVWVTALPLGFVGITTLTAAVLASKNIYWPLTQNTDPSKAVQGWINLWVLGTVGACVATVLSTATHRWKKLRESI